MALYTGHSSPVVVTLGDQPVTAAAPFPVTNAAGSALIGSVSIDQTTPGTTNAVSATNLPATVSVNTGATGASSPRVTVAVDSATIAGSVPGTAGTASANVISVQGIASMTPVQVSAGASATGGYSYLNIAAGQATTVVKGSAGTLHSIVLNSAATAANTTTIYDHATGVGTVIGRPAVTTATVPTTLLYDLAFTVGLTIITATQNGGDMTVVFK